MEVFSPAASPRCAELCQLLEPAEGITHMLRICRPCRCVTAAADISLLESPPDFLAMLGPFRIRSPLLELAEGIEPPTC